MAFIPKAWRNDPSTPSNAEALIDLEERLAAHSDSAAVALFGAESAVVPTAAPFVIGRARLRDRWTARDFGATGNGDDFTAELTAGIAETRAAGRVLHIPEGVYGVSASLTGAETSPLAVKGAGKGATTLQYTGQAAAMLSALGSIVAATTLSAPAARGATTLTLASTVGLAPGDLIVVRDAGQPINGNSANTQAAVAGQMRKIRSVDSGTQVSLRGRLNWAFPTGSDVRKITPARGMSLSNLSIVNPVPGTLGVLARAMAWVYAERIEIENVDFKDFDAACIYLQTAWNWRVAHCDFYELRDLEQAFNPYSVIASHGTQFGLMTDCKQHYGRHLFTTGPGASTEMAVQDILVSDCVATAMTQAAFDTHPGAVRIHFDTCRAFGCADKGYQIRGPDCTISNPIVDGATLGILATGGADRLRIHGGILADCDTGLQVQDSHDVRARDVEIESPLTNGVLVNESASWAGHMTRLRLRELDVRGNPSGAAYQFDKWSDGFAIAGLRAPDATTKIAGAPTTPTLNGLFGTGHAGDLAPTGFEGALLSLGLAANTAHLARYVPPRNRTITKLAFVVTTASGADDEFAVAIYSLNATVGVLTRLSTSGALTSASGAVSGGGLNTTGRKVVTIPTVDVVGGTVYYVDISAAAAGATIAAAGLNSTLANQLMGTGVPDIVAGSKATSHPPPATISGPSSAISGPKIAVLE